MSVLTFNRWIVDVESDDLEDYQNWRLSRIMRIGGAGSRISLKLRRRKGMYMKAKLPLELWLGRGWPLNPYLKAELRIGKGGNEALLQRLSRILKWSMLRCWMKQWLSYLKWYSSVACSPEVTFNDLVQAPVVTTGLDLRWIDFPFWSPSMTRSLF